MAHFERVIPRPRCYIDTGNIGAKSSVTPEFVPSPGNITPGNCPGSLRLSICYHSRKASAVLRDAVPFACPSSLKTGLHVIALRGFNLLKRRPSDLTSILTSTFSPLKRNGASGSKTDFTEILNNPLL